MIRFAKAFEPSSWAAALPGPNAGIPRVAECVGDARDERSLGSDHDEIDGVLVREDRDGGRVVRVEGDERRILPDAGVAGGGEDLVLRLLRAQGEDDGVLPRARAEDQDLHPASLPRRVRRRRGCVTTPPRREGPPRAGAVPRAAASRGRSQAES